MKNNVVNHFLFEESTTVAGDNFVATLENSTFRHFLLEEFFSQMVHQPTSVDVLVPFWRGSFLIVG
jgi:hypothetical protein